MRIRIRTFVNLRSNLPQTRFLRRFSEETNGNIAMLTGLSMLALFSMVALAVDGTRMLLARAEFQNAVDGAALAIGTTYEDEDTLEEIATRFVMENYSFPRTSVTSVSITSTPNEVFVQGELSIGLYMAGILTSERPKIGVTTRVQRAGGGLMVALVLDNTGSMWSTQDGQKRIETLRAASLRLTNVLFGDNEEEENLRVSVVPYASVVNPGAEAVTIVDYTGLNADGGSVRPTPLNSDPADLQLPRIQEHVDEIFEDDASVVVPVSTSNADFRDTLYLPHFRIPDVNDGTATVPLSGQVLDRRLWLRYDPTDLGQWKGCVFERPGDNSLSDEPPSTELWEPFIWPIAKDNRYRLRRWSGYLTETSTTQHHTNLYEIDPDTVEPGGDKNSNYFYGPNTGCPTPITPLTKTKKTVTDALNAMTAWNRGGTFSDVGMAWGYRTLTPGAPFTQSDTEIDPLTTQKIWESNRWRRAIVLMTDGNNVVYNAGKEGTYVEKGDERSDLTAYGRLGDTRFRKTLNTSNQGTAEQLVNTRMANLCENIKKDDVIIYSIVFSNSASESTEKLFRNCASTPGKYFYAPSADALDNAFGSIASDLNKLRILQ